MYWKAGSEIKQELIFYFAGTTVETTIGSTQQSSEGNTQMASSRRGCFQSFSSCCIRS
jgi:hypothetical protein